MVKERNEDAEIFLESKSKLLLLVIHIKQSLKLSQPIKCP